jgi:hypothetical protein
MDDSSIPLSDIQTYLKDHQSLILSLIELKDRGVLTQIELEKKLPNALK